MGLLALTIMSSKVQGVFPPPLSNNPEKSIPHEKFQVITRGSRMWATRWSVQ